MGSNVLKKERLSYVGLGQADLCVGQRFADPVTSGAKYLSQPQWTEVAKKGNTQHVGPGLPLCRGPVTSIPRVSRHTNTLQLPSAQRLCDHSHPPRKQERAPQSHQRPEGSEPKDGGSEHLSWLLSFP